MRKLYYMFAFFMFIGFSVDAQSKKELRKAKELEEYQQTKKLIEGGAFEIISDWATAQGGYRVNLIGNPNYLRIEGDSIKAYMPYFGVRTNGGGGYGDSGGIEIEGVLENYKVDIDDKKQRIRLEFEASNKNERLDFYITIYGSGSTSININGSTRSAIDYSGDTSTIKKDKAS